MYPRFICVKILEALDGDTLRQSMHNNI